MPERDYELMVLNHDPARGYRIRFVNHPNIRLSMKSTWIPKKVYDDCILASAPTQTHFFYDPEKFKLSLTRETKGYIPPRQREHVDTIDRAVDEILLEGNNGEVSRDPTPADLGINLMEGVDPTLVFGGDDENKVNPDPYGLA